MSEQDVFDALRYHIEVDEHGTRRYYNAAKQLHRTDGPAVEYVDGPVEWHQNGQLHRIDGPAIVCTNGHKEWWQNGQRHRTDGPAVMWISGREVWYINGKCVSEGDFNQEVKQKQNV